MAHIPLFSSQKPSTENGQFRVVALRLAWLKHPSCIPVDIERLVRDLNGVSIHGIRRCDIRGRNKSLLGPNQGQGRSPRRSAAQTLETLTFDEKYAHKLDSAFLHESLTFVKPYSRRPRHHESSVVV